MRTHVVLAALAIEINLYITGGGARHQQDSSANKLSVPLSGADGKNEEVVDGPTKEVLAQTGGTATLPCRLTNPGAAIVSWIRDKNRQLLTVGATTHSVDNRFEIRPSSSDWALVIKRVTLQDAGLYECQVATHPVQRNFARLKITEAYSVIPGAPDLHVKQGSSLRLECQLMSSTEPPMFVFWYRQDRMINYDAEGVKVEATKNGSVLMVNNTKPSHGGNYTCTPSNAKSAYVVVHVIEEEEKPAAMHGGDRRNLSTAILASNFLVSLLATVSWRIPSFTSLYPT